MRYGYFVDSFHRHDIWKRLLSAFKQTGSQVHHLAYKWNLQELSLQSPLHPREEPEGKDDPRGTGRTYFSQIFTRTEGITLDCLPLTYQHILYCLHKKATLKPQSPGCSTYTYLEIDQLKHLGFWEKSSNKTTYKPKQKQK